MKPSQTGAQMINRKKFFYFFIAINFLYFPLKATENHSPEEMEIEKRIFQGIMDNITPYRANTIWSKNSTDEIKNSTVQDNSIVSYKTPISPVFDQLHLRYNNFKNKFPNTDLYAFEESQLIQPLSYEKNRQYFENYKSLNEAVKIHGDVIYMVGRYQGKPFYTFSLANKAKSIYPFSPEQTQNLINTIRENSTWSYSEEEIRKLIRKGLPTEIIEYVLKKIDSFLPDPGLYIKVRNSYYIPKEVSDNAYITRRRGSFHNFEGYPSIQKDSPKIELKSKEDSNTPLSSPVNKKFKPRRGSITDYSAQESTAEFLEKYNKRRLSNSSSDIHSPSTPPSTPSSNARYALTQLSHELSSFSLDGPITEESEVLPESIPSADLIEAENDYLMS